MIDGKALERLRWRFHEGSEVELVKMDYPTAPPPGTRGKVLIVNRAGTVFVAWDILISISQLMIFQICRNAFQFVLQIIL